MSDLEGIARDAWLEWRRGGLGGSDIAAIVGLSRYASPTSIYFDKLGLLERDDDESQRQRIGKRLESVLAAEFNDMTGLHVVGQQTMCQHPDYPWARCTVDGFVADSPYGSHIQELTLGNIEFKSDGRFGWPDGIPANIRAQVVWQLGVTQQQHAWLVVMFAGFRVEIHEVAWHDEERADWAFMLEAARRFWIDNVMAGVSPPLDDHEATTAALTRYHGPDPDGIIEADADGRTLVWQVQHAMASTAAAEATEKRCKNELRAYLGDKTDLIDGWTAPKKGDPKPIVLASWREQETRRLDTTALRNAEPEICEKFTTTTTSRVLRVAKPKEENRDGS